MSDTGVQLVLYVVGVLVLTVILVTVITQHVHVQLSTIIQLAPIIIAALTQVQRALTSGQGSSTTSSTTVTTDSSAKNIHVEVAEAPQPVGTGKPDSPKVP